MSESHTVNGGSWNEKSVKISSQIGVGEEKWTSVPSTAAGKRKTETLAWGQDTGDANGNGKDWGVSLVGRPWKERSLFNPIGKQFPRTCFTEMFLCLYILKILMELVKH